MKHKVDLEMFFFKSDPDFANQMMQMTQKIPAYVPKIKPLVVMA